jgi:dienelactone hydrolase
MEPNMVGAYGSWVDALVEANEPGLLSYRRPEFSDVAAWREKARAKMLECLALPDSGGTPQVEVVERNAVDGVEAEILRWQLPYGPPTDAVFLKPAGATGPLPGIMALHDHGGLKYFGYRKIADDGRPLHPMLRRHRDEDYGGTAWANEIAKRGYAVLCHDTAPFASRRVRVADTPPAMHWGARDASPEETPEEINAYNEWAGKHEGIWAKSLMSAGTFWPTLFLLDDMRAVDVLCARPEVDATRIGCAGLSGGGCRTVYLAGLDERIQTGICAGMMTTWRDIALFKNHTHTWMMWTPMLAKYLDYAEILALQLPKPMLALSNNEDPLFTLSEMHRADDMLRAIYDKAGVSDRYLGKFYPGPHKLDLEMQADAWAWFDRWLKG